MFAPQVIEERALLAGLRGDADAAAAGLRAAHDAYAEIGAGAHAIRVAALLEVNG